MVIDVQKLLTSLTRQLLDNVYRINVGRKLISEDSMLDDGSTADAMDDRNAEFIPVHGRAADALYPEQQQSMIADILPVIQHAQASTSMRTGIAPENNVDADVLQQTTYGAFTGAMEKAGERLEMMIRIVAETGIKQLFRKCHALIRAHPDVAATVRLNGEWIESDPGSWEERDDVKVNVGAGRQHQADDGHAHVPDHGSPDAAYADGPRRTQAAVRDGREDGRGAGPRQRGELLHRSVVAELPAARAAARSGHDPRRGDRREHEDGSADEHVRGQGKADVEKTKAHYAGVKLKADIEEKAAKLDMDSAPQESDIENVEADTLLKMAMIKKAEADAVKALRPDPKPQPQSKSS